MASEIWKPIIAISITQIKRAAGLVQTFSIYNFVTIDPPPLKMGVAYMDGWMDGCV